MNDQADLASLITTDINTPFPVEWPLPVGHNAATSNVIQRSKSCRVFDTEPDT